MGIWRRTIQIDGTPRPVSVDLLVPDSLGGTGRRAARIPPHGANVAIKVVGLEGTLVDKDKHAIHSLEIRDTRRLSTWVGGPAGLLVAKVHKIVDRQTENDRDRVRDKDALDVLRLLRAVPVSDLASRIQTLLNSELARVPTTTALEELERVFGTPRSPGCQMAARAVGRLEDPDTIAASLVALTQDLRRAL